MRNWNLWYGNFKKNAMKIYLKKNITVRFSKFKLKSSILVIKTNKLIYFLFNVTNNLVEKFSKVFKN